MVYAVVVTYNRLALLKQVINALQIQTFKIDKIIVVNNDSQDGTKEWLDEQQNIFVIHQANVGGAGGFHTGVKSAHEQGAEWIWMMDDDIVPQPDCLETLLQYKDLSHCINPIHFDSEGIISDEERYFDIAGCNILSNFNISYNNGKNVWFRNIGHFEGMLIASDIVDKIGYPDPRFFVMHDDVIYGYLASKYTNVAVVRNAIMNKMKVEKSEKSIYSYIYYYYRNLWLLEEYAAKDLKGFDGYRKRRILKQFINAAYVITRSSDYKSKTTALKFLFKAYKDYKLKKTGRSI